MRTATTLARPHVDSTITATIKALAASRGQSVESVGVALGLPKRTIYRRTATGGWTAQEVAEIAAHFGVTEQSLYDGVVHVQAPAPDATGGYGPSLAVTNDPTFRAGRHLSVVRTA